MGRDVFPGERLRGVSTTTAAFALVLVTLAAIGVYSTVGTSFRPSSNTPTCVGTTTTVTVPLNRTSTTVQTCSVTQVVLGAGGCYEYGNGSSLCVRGAPASSVADSYINGTIIVTYPDGHKVTCNPAQGQGPCIIGIP
ncbi:MAG: hypothetical protein E6K86_05720 [Thaumarchaeota archaeon]|nr:MAG: hypothetical protein E6K90_04220 [Nitrososphaerota archaeon]TLY15761.1 MAG: hypothetical protein E6K86_05720 [Nitrososphaerota archaeon]